MPPEVTLLEIPPCQIPMCGVAYSCYYGLLLWGMCALCHDILDSIEAFLTTQDHQQNDWTWQCCVAYMYALFVLAPLAFACGALASMQCMTNLQQVKKHVPEQENSKFLTSLAGTGLSPSRSTCKIRMCACKRVAWMVKCLTLSLPGGFCSRNPKGEGLLPPTPPPPPPL